MSRAAGAGLTVATAAPWGEGRGRHAAWLNHEDEHRPATPTAAAGGGGADAVGNMGAKRLLGQEAASRALALLTPILPVLLHIAAPSALSHPAL